MKKKHPEVEEKELRFKVEFDLADIAELIRIDIDNYNLPKGNYSVQVIRRKKQPRIHVTGPKGSRDSLCLLVGRYIGYEWNDYHQAYRLNFMPIVKEE